MPRLAQKSFSIPVFVSGGSAFISRPATATSLSGYRFTTDTLEGVDTLRPSQFKPFRRPTMNKLRFVLQSLSIAMLLLAATSVAQAQATRTWVSGVGDDANPCSRTAPCKTFAGAISKTAAGGEISVLDPGGYGAVTITKSITIDGGTGAGWGSILACGTNGVIVNDSLSGSPNTIVVTLRNLSINGCGYTTSPGLNGIRFLSGKALHVENSVIFGFRSTSVGNGNGISAALSANGGHLLVKDTTITENLSDGIRATTTTGSIRVDLNNVRADRNGNGYHGLAGAAAAIVNSSFSSNATDGVIVEAGANGGTAYLRNSTMQSNGGDGLQSGPGAASVRIANMSIINNFGIGVNISAGSVFTLGNNVIRSNTTDISGGLLTTETQQ